MLDTVLIDDIKDALKENYDEVKDFFTMLSYLHVRIKF